MTIMKNIDGIVCSDTPQDEADLPTKKDYLNNTYDVISTVAFLDGTPKSIFALEYEPPKMEYFLKLQTNKHARIIRNLCMLRTSIEQNYSEINYQMTYNFKNLLSLPNYVPQECINQLEFDGISIIKANCKLNQYIIEINRQITNRINNCKQLFPIWLEWDYVKNLFIMPNGLSEIGIKAAATEYYANKNNYPYHVYINWNYKSAGNILYNDKKFLTLLYEANEDCFTDFSKVSNASNFTKENIFDFLVNSDRVAIMVDCENSDPYKLYAVLNNLNQQYLLNKVSKIILCDDINTTSAWDILEQFTKIPVEHCETVRVNQHKSIVDPTLSVKACIEHYENHVDAILLFGSDSDYWGLFATLKSLKYFVMAERQKFGATNRDALLDTGIPFCYIDDFCTGNSNQIKVAALLRELREILNKNLHFNVNDMLRDAFRTTRAEMTQAEQNQFYDRYLKSMRLVIEENGDLYIDLGQ